MAGRAVAGLVLLCCADFMFPFQATLSVLEEGGSVPAWLTGTLVWDAILLAQHVWALVVLAGVLIVAGTRVDVSLRVPSATVQRPVVA